MKIKKVFAFVALLTSSLAGVAEDVAGLEDKYYAGLNLCAEWVDDFKMKPGVVFGYRYNKKSQFELEAFGEIQSLKNVEASLLANYRYYLNPGTSPMKLYVGVGLGGYLKIIPFGSTEDLAIRKPQEMRSILGDMIDFVKDLGSTKGTKEKKDTRKPPAEKPTAKNKTIPPMEDKPRPQVKKETKVEDKTIPPVEEETKVEDKTISPVKEETKVEDKTIPPVIEEKKMLTLADKILSSISYKLKAGVDYELTSRIVGSVGIAVGGQLSGLKAVKIPDATLELGIRYNF